MSRFGMKNNDNDSPFTLDLKVTNGPVMSLSGSLLVIMSGVFNSKFCFVYHLTWFLNEAKQM
jgi:hypothetical protein